MKLENRKYKSVSNLVKKPRFAKQMPQSHLLHFEAVLCRSTRTEQQRKWEKYWIYSKYARLEERSPADPARATSVSERLTPDRFPSSPCSHSFIASSRRADDHDDRYAPHAIHPTFFPRLRVNVSKNENVFRWLYSCLDDCWMKRIKLCKSHDSSIFPSSRTCNVRQQYFPEIFTVISMWYTSLLTMHCCNEWNIRVPNIPDISERMQ